MGPENEMWKREAVRRACAQLDSMADEGMTTAVQADIVETVLYEGIEWLPTRLPTGEVDVNRTVRSLVWFSLRRDGQIVHFDNEGRFSLPEEYRELVAELALLTDGLLDDVSFSVEPPISRNGGLGLGPLVVAETESWQEKTRVAAFGDWCDTVTLLALLNWVVSRFPTEKRFVTLDISRDQCSSVFFIVPEHSDTLTRLLRG